TKVWSFLFYGLYVLAGAGAGALFVAALEYLFGGMPEAGLASWLAGVGFGLAGAAAMRADWSRVPEVGDSLVAIKRLGRFVRGALSSQIEAAAPSYLWKVPPGPLGDWVKRALENYYQGD